MDQKRLFARNSSEHVHEDDIYPEGRARKSKDRGLPHHSGLRASKRSLRNLG